MFDAKKFSGKIFIDMDGTLNFHQTKVKEYLENWLKYKFDKDIRDIKWFQDIIPFEEPALREYTMFKIYSIPNFWLSLKPDSRSANTLKSWIDNGYKIVILTATPPRENMSAETLEHLGGEEFFSQIADSKIKWLKQNYKEIDWDDKSKVEFKCVRTLNKYDFVEPNSIVIDDKSPFGPSTNKYHKGCLWIRIGLENRKNDGVNPDIYLSNWSKAKKVVSWRLRKVDS